MPVRLIVGGGIGAGKSMVCRLLAGRGFEVLEADRIGHDLLAQDHRVIRSVAQRWPETLVGGSVDRSRLARIVFADPAQLTELERLTHPAIRSEIRLWARGLGDRPAAVEVPVLADLMGPGWTRVTVDAPVAVKIERLRSRGMSERDIDRRMEIQPIRSDWLAVADFVLDNHGPVTRLEEQLDSLLSRLRAGYPRGSKRRRRSVYPGSDGSLVD